MSSDWLERCLDAKREAGRREHEGTEEDWAGWTVEDFKTAIAGELLDAANYAKQAAYGNGDAVGDQYFRLKYNRFLLEAHNIGVAACERAAGLRGKHD